MSTKTVAKSSTARKVVGSLGVIGAAAAVAGWLLMTIRRPAREEEEEVTA